MFSSTKNLSVVLAAAFSAVLPGVARAHDGEVHAAASPRVHYGQSAALGTGSVRTYVKTNGAKDPVTGRRAPVEIGVEIPWHVLNGLPAESATVLIDFPIQARDTPIQFMMLGWGPQGHEPPGIYDRAHFDFHFYFQDPDDVMAIVPGPCSGLDCEVYQRAMKPVPANLLAPGYMNVGSVVPYMGNHLVDTSSPEFHGQPFTRTFIYGAYDGQITFYEPMITYESLTKKEKQCSEIRQPQQVATAGYYPRQYCTEFDSAAGVYKMHLTGFTWAAAQQNPPTR